MQAHEIEHLAGKLRELQAELAVIADGDDLEAALRLIHRPGFTTPAEASLIAGLTESLIAQVRTTAALRNILTSGIERVTLNPQPLPP